MAPVASEWEAEKSPDNQSTTTNTETGTTSTLFIEQNERFTEIHSPHRCWQRDKVEGRYAAVTSEANKNKKEAQKSLQT